MRALALVTVLGSVLGCTDNADVVTAAEAADQAAAAKDLFWTALRARRAEDIPAAREAMIAAFANRPDDDELPRWIGFGGAIQGTPVDQGEGQMPEGPPDQAGQAERLDEAVAWLETAVAISRDPHVKTYNSGFLGGMLYNRGMQLGNAADAQRAREILDGLVRELPAFGYATRGDVMNRAAVGSADWATALESYFRFFEVCTGESIDRRNPDMTVVLRRPFASPDSTCGNWAHAAHGIQGFLVMFGDSLVKNGQPDAGRRVFELVPKTEGYASWQYKSIIDERLTADLVARAADFQTADQATAWGIPFGTDCFGCHGE